MFGRIVRLAVTLAALSLLALPAAATAASTPRQHSQPVRFHSGRLTTFELRGALFNYTAATPTSDGSITIYVTSADIYSRTYSDTSLTFLVTTDTRVFLHSGKPIADGDEGVVEVPITRSAVASQFSSMTASAIVDLGAPARPQHLGPVVTFVLKGTLSDYAAAYPSGRGSITIHVKSINLEPRVFDGTSLTFAVGPKTIVVLPGGKPIANGDPGIVKVRVSKLATALDLQSGTASQVIDQRPSPPHAITTLPPAQA
jgi:hypothetical protein